MGIDADVTVYAGGLALEGHLGVPEAAEGIVVFADDRAGRLEGAVRASVVRQLHTRGLATLQVDLLSDRERLEVGRPGGDEVRHEDLVDRLVGIVRWLREQPRTADLRVGYFGANLGVAGVLRAARQFPLVIGAVVCRGGRPDRLGEGLREVRAPTLFIVGEEDRISLEGHEEAYQKLQSRRRLHVLPGVDTLYDEPSGVAEVADLTCEWFNRHLAIHPGSSRPSR